MRLAIRSNRPLPFLMRFLLSVAMALVWTGCGYVGEPLPPALHIPERATGLAAIERGSEIVVTFTLPTHSTEGLLLNHPVTYRVSIGPAPTPFQMEAWEAGARSFGGSQTDHPDVRQTIPAADWIGKLVLIGVKVIGSNGRAAGWSKLVTLSVVPPVTGPSYLRAEAVPTGVRLTWQGSAPTYRVYRRAGEDKQALLLGETTQPEYTAAAEFGMTYHFSVEGVRTGPDIRAFSEVLADAAITPVDTFPPAVPSGLKALAATNSIELAWDRDTEPDLAGYRIYRVQDTGAFVKLGETQEVPSYSDHSAESGKTYRYAVSAFDKVGNESEKSRPVEVAAP